MELFFFARFHVSPGQESALQEALKEVVVPSREEAGCLSIYAFRSTITRACRHTVRFLERAMQLIDHALDTTRTTLIA